MDGRIEHVSTPPARKVTGGGASGATVGTGGSVNSSGMVSILHATRVHARHIVDPGSL